MPDPAGPQGAVAAVALWLLVLAIAVGVALIWVSGQYVGRFAKGIHWRRALIAAYLIVLAGAVYQIFGFSWMAGVLLSLPLMWYLVLGGMAIVLLWQIVARKWSEFTKPPS